MFVTSKHVLEIKTCRYFLKDNYLLSAVSNFIWTSMKSLIHKRSLNCITNFKAATVEMSTGFPMKSMGGKLDKSDIFFYFIIRMRLQTMLVAIRLNC